MTRPILHKVTKIGSVEEPIDPNSKFGESKPFHFGIMLWYPTPGHSFILSPYGKEGFRSSMVTKVNDDGTFETLNSIYKLEEYTDYEQDISHEN